MSGKFWEIWGLEFPRLFQTNPRLWNLSGMCLEFVWNLSGICLEFVWVGSSKSKVDKPKHMCLVDRGRPGPKNTLPSPLPLPLPLPRPLPLPLALPHTPTPTPHPYYPSPTHTLTPTRTATPSYGFWPAPSGRAALQAGIP